MTTSAQKRIHTIKANTILNAPCYSLIGGDVKPAVPTKVLINSLIGSGTFGNVYDINFGIYQQLAALKQIRSTDNIDELQILMRIGHHCNIIPLLMYFNVNIIDTRYLMLAMERMPMSLRSYVVQNRENRISMLNVRILSYQLFRGLAHLHSWFVSHRDIKPDNLLINPHTMVLKICDFGSAKCIMLNEKNDTYVCTEAYRAPELLAQICHYTHAVDIWSAGCVLAELISGITLFHPYHRPPNCTALQNVIRLLGLVGLDRAPQVQSASGIDPSLIHQRANWSTMWCMAVPNDLTHLLDRCLVYEPEARISAIHALAHSSYNQLRLMDTMMKPMPNGVPMPDLFNFSMRELEYSTHKLWVHLLPIKMI